MNSQREQTVVSTRATQLANMLFVVDTDQPYHKSSGVINDYFRGALTRAGFQVQRFHRQRVHRDPPTHVPYAERLIPLSDLALLHQIAVAPNPSITFYDGLGLDIWAPRSLSNHRNVVFLHGLRGCTGLAVANAAIDLYCCNSDYLSRVLSSFMLLPDWRRRELIDPRGSALVRSLRLPIPILEYPDGYPNEGGDLTKVVIQALDSDAVIGHSIQRDKASPTALLCIVRALNELAKARGTAGFRLVVSTAIMPELEDLVRSHFVDDREEMLDWFIPVRLLNNSALVSLMRRCRFGLCYNRVPESFGIYPLESVFVGCPIYSNGAGNNRWLLPPHHGITVYESESMAFGGLDDYNRVAQQILEDLDSGHSSVDCDKGAAYIAMHHSRVEFEHDLNLALATLDQEITQPEVEFKDTVFDLSPLVRWWNPDSGRVISDHRNLTLDGRLSDLVANVCGMGPDQLGKIDCELARDLDYLFHSGVLQLRTAPQVAEHTDCSM